MNYSMKECGNRIRQFRVFAGYTQSEPASKLNVNRSFLSYIEAGEKGCSVDLLVQLSQLFCVTIDYLVLGKNELSMEEEVGELIARLTLFKNNLNS